MVPIRLLSLWKQNVNNGKFKWDTILPLQLKRNFKTTKLKNYIIFNKKRALSFLKLKDYITNASKWTLPVLKFGEEIAIESSSYSFLSLESTKSVFPVNIFINNTLFVKYTVIKRIESKYEIFKKRIMTLQKYFLIDKTKEK